MHCLPLPTQVLTVFREENVVAIIHAGDVSDPDGSHPYQLERMSAAQLIAKLGTVAPVTVVRGNNDDLYDPIMAASLPNVARVQVGPVRFTVHHGDDMDIQRDPLTYLQPENGWQGVRDVVITGHSHRPVFSRREGGVLFLNPGAAGPRRGSYPRRIAVVTLTDEDDPPEEIQVRAFDLWTMNHLDIGGEGSMPANVSAWLPSASLSKFLDGPVLKDDLKEECGSTPPNVRRRLRELGIAAAARDEVSVDSASFDSASVDSIKERMSEEAWLSAWTDRFECWFVGLPLPTQAQMGTCLGAMGMHLGSRLDSVARSTALKLGKPPGRIIWKPPPPISIQEGCEMVTRSMEVSMPDFPDTDEILDRLSWLAFPRLLPAWERLQTLTTQSRRASLARMSAQPREASREALPIAPPIEEPWGLQQSRGGYAEMIALGQPEPPSVWLPVSIGAGITLGAVATFGVYCAACRIARRIGRPQIRPEISPQREGAVRCTNTLSAHRNHPPDSAICVGPASAKIHLEQ